MMIVKKESCIHDKIQSILLFMTRFFLLQECYEACSNLDQKQFTLSPNLNEDHEIEADKISSEHKLFLEYDRQQIIFAQIANFDKTKHR